MGSTSTNGMARILERPIHHFKQRFSWDCGVSCVLMVLPDKERDYLLENFTNICKDEGFNKSTWTIDLCYLLKRFDVKHEFNTITKGVHPGYYGQTFYEKIIHKDEERVNMRFEQAEAQGLKVDEQETSTDRLLSHLGNNGPVILLTNASLINCDICKANKLATELRSCLPWKAPFHGHYIVLCGYNMEMKKFMYRNPAYKDRLCMMSFRNLNAARSAYGTDHDTILVYDRK